jgi:hypothetical protein
VPHRHRSIDWPCSTRSGSTGTPWPWHALSASAYLGEWGYLGRENRVVGSRVRKDCILTAVGARALGEARSKIRELVGEVLGAATRRGFGAHSRGRMVILIRPEILRARQPPTPEAARRS